MIGWILVASLDLNQSVNIGSTAVPTVRGVDRMYTVCCMHITRTELCSVSPVL
mgnify:CR=1 FL=1